MSVSCPVCLAPHTVHFGVGTDFLFETTNESFSLQSCTDCRCLFLEPMPGPEEIASFYPTSYWWDGSGSGLLRRLESVYRRMVLFDHLSFISRAAHAAMPDGRPRILDVGCGPGTVLGLLKSRGFEVHGLDASSEASSIAKRDHGVDVTVGTLDSGTLQGESFDAVVLLHTLEHVPDPHRVLAQARRLLKPAGRLVLQVPNVDSIQCRVFGARWYGLDVPRHLIDYSRASLLGLLDASGFQVEQVRNFNFRDNAPSLASSLFPRLDPMSRAVRCRHSDTSESGIGTWFRHIAYLTAVLASYPPALTEAALGRGATLTVRAFRK